MNALPYQTSCCTPCDDPTTVNIPGAQGVAGADGTNGADGVNAYSFVAGAGFNMPAIAGTETVTVDTTAWMVVGQIVYVGSAGWMRVSAITDGTTVDLENIETAGGAYGENVAAGTAIAVGEKISPGGLQGVAGADGGATGTMAAQDANNVAITGGSITGITDLAVADGGTGASTAAGARTNLGLVIGAGGQVQAYDALLTAIAALVTAADKLPYCDGVDTVALADLTAFGRTLIANADAAAARADLQVLKGFGLLGTITADMNIATDQEIAMASTNYIIRYIVACNASLSLTTAAGGVYAAASKTTAIVAAGQVYSALTAAAKFVDLTLTTEATQNVRTEASIYLSLTTPQGAAATADIYVFGQDLS